MILLFLFFNFKMANVAKTSHGLRNVSRWRWPATSSTSTHPSPTPGLWRVFISCRPPHAPTQGNLLNLLPETTEERAEKALQAHPPWTTGEPERHRGRRAGGAPSTLTPRRVRMLATRPKCRPWGGSSRTGPWITSAIATTTRKLLDEEELRGGDVRGTSSVFQQVDGTPQSAFARRADLCPRGCENIDVAVWNSAYGCAEQT